MRTLVLMLLSEGVWKFSNGLEPTSVLGMSVLLCTLLAEVIWTCSSGRGPTDARDDWNEGKRALEE